MRIWTWALAVSLAPTGIAVAQPAPTPIGPPPVAEPPPPPPTAVVAAAHLDASPEDTGRPTGLAFGIGFGYAFPTSLQTPNVTSVRVRLSSGLTLEPQLALATTSNSADNGTTMTDRQTEITIGSLVRYPLKAHRKVDLELVGSAALSTRVLDPEGDNNNRTITAIGLGYGVALAYWVTPHWNVSLTATNPLVSYARNRQESATMVAVNSTTSFGLVFDPQIALMLHLYD
jgi:hypothetical protein